ncbi:hypothetical protein ASD44_07960 [Mesorhizobium sp. Root554]|nr:hypothetical protein ASD27_07970 [Mesorhizobium sp. Root1471]KQZ36529.1 hypothetical protein ASD44_07960 [Mesorhizobium sp. Root554]
MELFPASDETQWELIKRVIEESDYYIVIVGGKYGSLGPSGKSYTEMEYDYAVEQGLPVLGFVRSNLDLVAAKYVETDLERRTKLDEFRKKVMARTCRKFADPLELGMAVIKSLMHETRVRPRVGWLRSDQARSEEDKIRERKLEASLEEATNKIKKLERRLRDGALLTKEIDRSLLSQGADKFRFNVFFQDESKRYVSQAVDVSWDEIFRSIAPPMYGYIMRKMNSMDKYPFEDSLVEYIRLKVIDRSGKRNIDIQPGQVEACVFQFKELGYIAYDEKEDDKGTTFRGIILTEEGERYLARLMAQVKS